MKKLKLITTSLFAPLLLGAMPLTMVSCNQDKTYKNPNPHTELESPDVIKTVESVKRMDNDGYLYFMENTEDYYGNAYLLTLITLAEQLLQDTNDNFVDACSAFCAQDFDGAMITGRAYDFPHINEGETKGTGVNVMIHTPKDTTKGIAYESIGTSDAHLVGSKLVASVLKNGSLDDGTTDISFTSILPYMTTDGINEKGLTASVVLLPNDKEITSEFAKTESEGVIEIDYNTVEASNSIPRMIRRLLDNCATVEDAEAMFKKTWCTRIVGQNFHILVTDANGNCKLFEMYDSDLEAQVKGEGDGKQQLMIIDSNVATNFYQRFSKAREGMPQITGLKRKPEYQYGYSKDAYRNTYDRFNTIASMLDFYTPATKPESGHWNAIMKEQTMDAILRVVSLYPSDPAGVDSQTQYSCLFNSKNLTQKIYSYSDLSKSWTYSLKEHKFI